MLEHHHHHHSQTNNIGNPFKIGISINLLFIVAEVFYGFISNSMALVSDAGHNFSDVLALVFSWMAIRLSQKKPTFRFTYGFRRSTILAAILNTLLLLVAVVFIIWETLHRWNKPMAIDSDYVMIVAAVGIVVNGFTAWLFIKGKKQDVNIRSAFTHFVADALVSLGVVVAGLIMAITGIYWIDSVVSFVIIVVIVYSSYHLLIDSVSLALDAVPENIDIQAIRQFLCSQPEITGIHDLHVWALGTNTAALTVHIQTNTQTDVAFITNIQQKLKNDFKIEHATIQVEYGRQSELCNDCN